MMIHGTDNIYEPHVAACMFLLLVDQTVNPSTGTLKLHSNGPLYSNMVIGILAVDGWAVTFGTARRGLGGLHILQCVVCTIALHSKRLKATNLLPYNTMYHKMN